MKKIIIVITIFLITFSVIFLNLFSKEEKEIKENNNISIILETEEGNIESDTFPNKDFYEFSNIVCENTNDNITPTFNNETWKLNLSVEKESIDGNFNCVIYFKHTPRIASDYIISKYTENNAEGLIKLEQPETEQTSALTEYRYSGSNDVVKNYVEFNNELWRIIGVFPTDNGTGNIENRVKIIRNESIDGYSWDSSPVGVNDFIYNGVQYYGGGVNQWGESGTYNGADLMRLLNPGYESESINNSLYWNRGSGTCYAGYSNRTTTCDFTSSGLTSEAKSMIEGAKWYTAAVPSIGTTTSQSYEQERGNTTGTADIGITITKTINWIGKVGLMYPSDYGYASSGCYKSGILFQTDGADYRQEACTSTNWLYNDEHQWLLSPSSGDRRSVFGVYAYGVAANITAADTFSTRPVTFLISSVKITGGDGTLSSPYELAL